MIRMFLAALLLVGGGLLAWVSLKSDPAQTAVAAPIAMAKILVAAEPLQAGTLLKDVDFKEREIATADVTPADLVSDENNRSELRGAMLRHYVEAGQVIRRADILRSRDRGFLATVLAPGTRAISIGVDATTGASGLISPGDLVDVILTQEFARGETTAGRRVVAETVLNRVRVIAVDQQIAQGVQTQSGLPTSASATRVASNVSLQVTPEQAAKVIVAGHLGRLTLAVRSIDGDQPADSQSSEPLRVADQETKGAVSPPAPPPGSVFGSDVSSALSNEAPASSPKMRVIQGDAVNDMVFH